MKKIIVLTRLISLVLFIAIASCNSPSPHSIPVGSVDGIIPAPIQINSVKDSSGVAEIGFYQSGVFRVEGMELLPNSREVIENWMDENAGFRVEEAGGRRPNLIFQIPPDFVVGSVEKNSSESYELKVSDDIITIKSISEVGLFRGWTTLRLLMPRECEFGGCSKGFMLPEVVIKDAPAFEHRGLLLDCCRHFMEPEFIMKMIDLLALHKMNVLHWHLTEDQGWRVEIDAYPRLTEVGAWRTESDGSVYGGYYSKEIIRSIIKYASSRHVEIIPEIELPGHSQAALASYPWLGCTGDSIEVANRWGVFKDIYCAGNDSTFIFLEKVLDEICDLFPSNLIHIGGDEAPKVRWTACEKCSKRIKDEGLKDELELQTWFINRIGRYLESKGKTLIGWDEILEGGLPEGATVQSWRGMDGAVEAVHLGADVIVSPTSHCYLDYPLSSTDLEEVYGFNPVPKSAKSGPGRVIGGECNMWTEHAPQQLVESKVFPRAIGLAEVLWSGPEFTGAEGSYSRFLSRLESHLSRLDILDVDYGLESVPVSLSLAVQDNSLFATVAPSGSYIKCTSSFITDSKQGQDHTSRYSVPLGTSIKISGPGKVRSSIVYRGRKMPQPIHFPVDGHAGVYHPVQLGFIPSPYYTGGGDYALCDGKLGSLDFRDGTWQAVQGEDLIVTVDLEKEVLLDSIYSHFYRYQDAWIFNPETVIFEISSDGVKFEEVAIWAKESKMERNDDQEIVTIGTGKLSSKSARFIRMRAENPGVCPKWHAAYSEPTWLFCDELIIREKK